MKKALVAALIILAVVGIFALPALSLHDNDSVIHDTGTSPGAVADRCSGLPQPLGCPGNPFPDDDVSGNDNDPFEDCHGANQVNCRPDPQPDYGRDCEVSDDHVCEPTTSSTQPPVDEPTTTSSSTTTTVPPSTTTSSTIPGTVDSTTTTTTLTQGSPPDSPSVVPTAVPESVTQPCIAADGTPYGYNGGCYVVTPMDQVPPTSSGVPVELARTGVKANLLWVGLVLLFLGIGLVVAGKNIRS